MRKEDIERLREEVDIVELVGEVVSLEKRGTITSACARFTARRRRAQRQPGAPLPLLWVRHQRGHLYVGPRARFQLPEAARYLAERWGGGPRSALQLGKGAASGSIRASRPCAVSAKRLKRSSSGADDAGRACRLRVPPPAA